MTIIKSTLIAVAEVLCTEFYKGHYTDNLKMIIFVHHLVITLQKPPNLTKRKTEINIKLAVRER